MKHAIILIVDDDIEDQIIFKEVLNEQNYYAVLYFDSAQLVLSYLSNLKSDDLLPKLIISDINMPKISGMELLQQIKLNDRYKQIKVLMLSTASENVYSESERLGAYEFIQKPDTYTEMKRLARYVTALTIGMPLPPFKQMPISKNV
jgi:DNA-binding NtrC family response regulator